MAESPAPPTRPIAGPERTRAARAPAPCVEPSDEDWVAAALDGDPDAFGHLMARWQRPVYRAIWRIVGQAQDAEDLTQETFLRAYAALAHFDPRYRFGGWVLRIATNLSLNFRRRRGRETVQGGSIEEADAFFERRPDDDAASPERQASSGAQAEQLWRAVEALPDDFRVVVTLRHVIELSYEEIAATLDLPMGTVKSRLARARRQLLDAVER